MKSILMKWLMLAIISIVFSTSTVYAGGAVVITKPATGSSLSSLVKVCMAVHGVEVQPAKKGVNPGKGHHHLLI